MNPLICIIMFIVCTAWWCRFPPTWCQWVTVKLESWVVKMRASSSSETLKTVTMTAFHAFSCQSDNLQCIKGVTLLFWWTNVLVTDLWYYMSVERQLHETVCDSLDTVSGLSAHSTTCQLSLTMVWWWIQFLGWCMGETGTKPCKFPVLTNHEHRDPEILWKREVVCHKRQARSFINTPLVVHFPGQSCICMYVCVCIYIYIVNSMNRFKEIMTWTAMK